MFNMHYVSEQIDLLITELAEDAKYAPEIEEAQELMMEVKALLKQYSDRLRNTSYASYDKSHIRRVAKRVLLDSLTKHYE